MRTNVRLKVGQKVKVQWLNGEYMGRIQSLQTMLDVDDLAGVVLDHSNHMIPYYTSDLKILEETKVHWLKEGF